jgi:hypothetical protein
MECELADTETNEATYRWAGYSILYKAPALSM